MRIFTSIFIFFCFTLALTAQSKKYDHSDSQMYHEIEADVRFLSSDALEGRATGERGEMLAAEYIKSRFTAIGLEPGGTDGSYFQPFSVESENPHGADFTDADSGAINTRNVIGYIDHGKKSTIVIGAHFDHLGYGKFFGSLHDGEPEIHNGADDNASGVAAIIQLAEICTKKFNHANFLIIAFSGEEHGLWGSNYFVKNPTIDLEKIRYMINLDMVGRLKEERKISINGVGTAAEWMDAINAIDVDGLEAVTTESGVGASDHTSFYFAEIPVVHFFTGQHSEYHKPSDDADLIDFSGIVSVVNYITALIENIGKQKMAYLVTKDETEPSARDFKVTLGVMPDYLYTENGMRIDGLKPDRPASNAGIEKGDIVIKMGDLEITGMEDYMNALGAFNPGETTTVIVIRDGKTIEKQVTF
jgi:Zn-dependent M28 family amino/carboxypeptidase